jgi:large subunit ribosomal protein L25
MEPVELRAQPRELTGKRVRHLRRQGLVPAVVYGRHSAPTPVLVEAKALRKALAQAGTNRLITLHLDGTSTMILTREVQRHPLTHNILHVDFFAVVMTEKITAEVPITLVGESPVVRRGDGILFQGTDTVAVEALPADIPPTIEVDLSGLEAIDQAIHVGDLRLPPAIEVQSPADEIIAKVLPATEETFEEEVAGPEAEVEVISEAKAESRRATEEE